jgi:RNA polymerase sigma-70 factor (ECF subfamily)
VTAKVVPIREPYAGGQVLSDETVAAASSNGDAAALAELFDRFHLPVSRFLSRVVGTGPDVEDLVQATFLEVARGKARFEGRSAARTWLFGIAANVARHHFRSVTRRRRLQSALSLLPRRIGQSPDTEVETKRKLTKAAHALETLPPSKRMAFIMCEVEGLSAQEAAKALGTTEGAVWKRVSMARKAIVGAARQEES